jgi:hypothetical protein
VEIDFDSPKPSPKLIKLTQTENDIKSPSPLKNSSKLSQEKIKDSTVVTPSSQKPESKKSEI